VSISGEADQADKRICLDMAFAMGDILSTMEDSAVASITMTSEDDAKEKS